VTWLAMTSMRLESRDGKSESKGASTNCTSQPASLPTAFITSMSNPVSSLVFGSRKVKGG
jgi:threonine/homoserine/homoserine lactone efflux protein